MSRWVGVIIVLLLVLLATGILIPVIFRARTLSDREVCREHFRRISFSSFHACLPNAKPPAIRQDRFPSGTIFSPQLAPEDRLSWFPMLLTSLGQDPLVGENPKPAKVKKQAAILDLLPQIDLQKPWNVGSNQEVAKKRITIFLCPGNVPNVGEGYAVTQYVGMAGLGPDVAKLSLDDAGVRAGIFRYDTPTRVSDIRDGTSQTVAFMETNNSLGPWMQGGPSTVRELLPNQVPYFGVGRQFGGLHVGGTNVGMADGSLRFFTESTNWDVFRAQCTIAGRENVFGSE
jgi:hypothetical protein